MKQHETGCQDRLLLLPLKCISIKNEKTLLLNKITSALKEQVDGLGAVLIRSFAGS